jgi:hypothetical protein
VGGDLFCANVIATPDHRLALVAGLAEDWTGGG